MPRGSAVDASAHEDVWPRWTPVAQAGFATFLAVVVAFEARPGLSVGARVVVTAIPAIAWLVEVTPKRPPFLVHALVIVSAVAVLVWHAAKFDAAPFFLVLLIGEAVVVARSWQAIAVAAMSAGLLAGLDVAGRYDGAIVWLLAFGFTWSGVALLQSRLGLIDQLSERAALEERQRIARELHDVIAHSLAVTMLQLTGARLALERDPGDAAQALLVAERLGRQSLAEIRRTVGLLTPGDGTPTAPMPTAGDIPGLVREVADAGLGVQLDCDGDLNVIAPAAGLSLYRIVQESLANVVKHASGAPAMVRLRIDPRTVCVDIDNPLSATAHPGATRDGGSGLTLMRERAELLGGSLRVGRDGDRWHVHVEIPTTLSP